MERVSRLNSYDAVPRKGVSWRAILAGVVTILSVMLILNLLGIAIGLGSIEPTEESNPLSGLGTGTLIWWILSNLIALFLGGFVAARVGVSFSNKSGIIQGIMTWALYTIISAWLLTSTIGSIISGVGNLVGNVVSSAGSAISNTVSSSGNNQSSSNQDKMNQNLDISLEEAKQRIYGLLEDTNKPALDPDRIEENVQDVTSTAQNQAQQAAQQPGNAKQEIDQIFQNAKNEFQNTFEALDKEALVNVITERTNMTEAEAERAVENYTAQFENLRQQTEQFLQNAEQEVTQQAENVAQAVSDAALYLAIALILGILVAAGGGYLGVSSLRTDYADTHYVRDERVDYRE